MPLRELVSYYDQIVEEHPDEVAPIGWSTTNASYVAVIDTSGRLRQVVELVERDVMRKTVPQQVKRAVNVASNFLCDNSSYIFGVDNKGNATRTAKCFAAARALHHELLDGLTSVCAQALLGFFDSWQPDREVLTTLADGESILNGRNIVFMVRTQNGFVDPLLEDDIHLAWMQHLAEGSNGSLMRCLVTGDLAPVARLHPPIKGVYGAQSSGASLVSFNAPAFESYGHVNEQGKNAPVSERAAQAYAAALNYLLSKPNHHVRLGDTTVVYWADRQDDYNADWFSIAMGNPQIGNGSSTEDANTLVDAAMRAIARGEYRNLEGIDADATFFVLGLAPSAARLVVRFFFKDTFGSMLDNLRIHYQQTDVSHSSREREYLTPFQLIREVENPKAKKPVVAPVLAGPLLESMLANTPYPQTLYTNALLRTHAEQEDDATYNHKVSRGRAAIIRAYLLRNCKIEGFDERGLTVGLNQQRNETAYNLGRAFAIFARIQEEANGKDTITNRYYNAASTTPLSVFPSLIRLSNAHLAKIERTKAGLAVYFTRSLDEVFGEDRIYVFPKRFTLEEQGDFALGYYHQRQDRYTKKAKAELASVNDEEE